MPMLFYSHQVFNQVREQGINPIRMIWNEPWTRVKNNEIEVSLKLFRQIIFFTEIRSHKINVID